MSTSAAPGGTDRRSPFDQHTISGIVPCYNEEDCVVEAYRRISAALADFADYEILFIDDGSTDGTLGLIRRLAEADPRVRYIEFSRNFGLEAAFSAGYRYASHPWLAQFDADLQSPPDEVTTLFATALDGYDAVFSERVDRKDPRYRRFGSSLQHLIAGRVLGIELPRRGSIFRVLRTSVARKVMETDLGLPYFLATLPLLGARYTSVPTAHRPRLAGESKWRLRQLLGHTMDLYIGFSIRPLGFTLTAAVVLAALAALVGVSGLIEDPSGLVALALVGQLVLTVAVSAAGPYLVRIIRGQSRSVRLFQIRSANFPVAPADCLYQYEMDTSEVSDRLVPASRSGPVSGSPPVLVAVEEGSG